MKRPLIATLASLALVAGAVAQTPPAAKGAPAMLVAQSFAAEAEVVGIDQATRSVTLKSADGSLSTGVVGPEVKNLAQVKVGDTVLAQYSQALAVTLKKGSGIRDKTESAKQSAAAPGERPAAAAVREVHITADIVKLDAATGALTVKGPKGRLLDLTVQDPKVLAGYQAGDQVEGTFLQVLVVGVVPPGEKK